MRRALFVIPLLIARAGWPQGNPIGPEFRVNTAFNDKQRAPDVASDSSGAFVVVWASSQYGTRGVYGQRYDSSGAPLGTQFLVSTYTAHPGAVFDIAPAVASDPSGNFVVVWESDGADGSALGILGQRYASSGAPLGPQFQVNTSTTFIQYQPAVAADGSGNFVVVWEHNPGDGTGGILGQRFASSGAPAGPEFLVSDGTADFQRKPAVSADAAGGFVSVWMNVNDSTVRGRRFSSGGAPAGGEFFISGSGYPGEPAVAADPAGDFVVVWENHYQDGSYGGVSGRRYAVSGAPLGSEFRVNTYTTADQLGPSVAADADGNFVVAWSGFGSADTNGGVFGQRYAASGTPLGSEFRVNTYTTGFQFSSSVAADSTGNFVVVWSSDAQDGDDFGIFGQRYAEIVPVELLQFAVE